MVLSCMTSPVSEQLTLSDFDYDLPEHLVAQEPATLRDHSRLMMLNRISGAIEHRLFMHIEDLLVPGDLLVLNNTKVMPCRLLAKKPGLGKAEIFLINEQECNVWEALVKGESRKDVKLSLDLGVQAEIIGESAEGVRVVRFHGTEDIRSLLPKIGRTPLPPYIKHAPSERDLERYQTVYAAQEGAVAAPTAGLHFTPQLIERLIARGIEIAPLTLHVGPGTFQPVREHIISRHQMLPERYDISPETAERINCARAERRRVVAVGTTSVRTIETAATGEGMVASGPGISTLFIHPGYRFRIVDAIITNFHLPKSTLLMLVSAFAGREYVLSAYRAAVSEQYRFYSYGDAMIICQV